MKRAALYIRVSTEDQARHGLSLEAQKNALRAFADSEGYKVIGEFSDEGISARKPYTKRPALLRLLRLVETEQIDTILFCRLDRWFRSVQAYYQIQPILDAHNVAWKAIQEDYETETASGRFKVNIMLSVAQDEADRTAERMRFIFDSKKARGEVISRSIPIGCKIVDKHLAVDEETAPVIRRAYKTFLEQRNLTAVVRQLRADGFDRAPKTVSQILRNPKYRDTGLIDAVTWDAVQALCESRSCRYARVNTFLFSGLIVCPHCGHILNGNKKKESPIYHYRCQQTHCERCDWRKGVREDFLEQYLLDHIEEELRKQVKLSLAPVKKAPAVDPAKIRAKMAKLKDLYLEDLIQKSEYEKSYRELEEQLETSKADRASYLPPAELLSDGVRIYTSLDRERRKAFWSRILDRVRPLEDGTFEIEFKRM